MTYSSSLAVGRQRYAAPLGRDSQASASKAWGKNQNTTSFRERGKAVGPISNTIILIVLACLVGLLYLTQVTKTNAYSYRINDLKDRQVSLKAEHDQLAINSARLQAQERVRNSDIAEKLVSAAPAAVVQN